MKAGWEIRPLGEVAEIVNGGTPKTSIEDYWGGGVLWLTPKEMGAVNGAAISSTERTISQSGLDHSSARLVPENSVILSTRAPIGYLAINAAPMAFNQGCRGIVPGVKLDPFYLRYFLQANVALLNSLGTGATFKELSASNLKRVEIPIPPLEEQKRIVARLDAAFAAIDSARRATEAARDNATTLLENAISDRISELEQNSPSAVLENFCEKITVGHVGPMASKYKSYGVIFLRSLNIKPFRISLENIKYIDSDFDADIKKSRLLPGDVVIVRTGNPGIAAVMPMSIAQANCSDLVIVKPKSNLSADYLVWLLNSKFGRDLVNSGSVGAAQKHFNVTSVKKMTIPFPSYEQQIQYVEAFDDLSKKIEQLNALHNQKLQHLDALRQALLRQAFAGELVDTSSPEFSAQLLVYAYEQHRVVNREKSFGRVKAQKFLHLAESIAGLDLGRNPIRDAAGPHDEHHMRDVENYAKAQNIFEFTRRSISDGYDFQLGKSYHTSRKDALKAVAPYKDNLKRILALLRPMNKLEAEVLATAHAAWNNFLLDGASPSDPEIVQACIEWHPDKEKIPVEMFHEAIRLMRNEDIVPDGSSKRVGGQERLL